MHTKTRTAVQSLQPLVFQVYVPNLLFATGQGAILPILALAARGVGASPAQAGLIVAANGLGTMLFDIPAGWVVARLGEQRASSVAAALVALGLVGALVSTSPLALAASIFLAACGWAVWVLVRLTHVSRVAPPLVRGRALSVLGGVTRTGAVIGPFLVVGSTSSSAVRVAFVIYLACAVVGFLLLSSARDKEDEQGRQPVPLHLHPLRIVGEHGREFATAGVGAFTISLLRSSRQVVVPLWGAHLGLSVSQISLIFGLSSVIDVLLFYPAGTISDRYGRSAVALPCLILLSLGHIVLPLSHTFFSLLAVAIVLGIGNGLGSGIVMTLGADRAPAIGRAAFLSVWRLFCDAGTASGPLLCAAAISVASLSSAGPALGVTALGATLVVARFMRDPSLPMEAQHHVR